MTPQSAILQPVPDHARHLFFDLKPAADPRAALRALAAACDGTSAVLGAPLLVLDMYEHSYHMDFGAAAARYVDAFMDNVRWDEVSRRAEWASKVRRG